MQTIQFGQQTFTIKHKLDFHSALIRIINGLCTHLLAPNGVIVTWDKDLDLLINIHDNTSPCIRTAMFFKKWTVLQEIR